MSYSLRAIKHLFGYVIVYTLLFIIISSSSATLLASGYTVTPSGVTASSQTNHVKSNQSSASLEGYKLSQPISLEVRDSEVGASYSPVTKNEETGDNFTVKDYFTVTHNDQLNVSYRTTTPEKIQTGTSLKNDTFTIAPPNNYSNETLRYNITSITAQKGYYIVENERSSFNTYEYLSNYDLYALAQSFTVEWDYATFYGAKVYLVGTGGADYGNYEMDLILVNATDTSPYIPNMSAVLSHADEAPFNNSNWLPPSSPSNVHYYSFTPVILEKGRYYIVANLTKLETNDQDINSGYRHFSWYYKTGTNYLTFVKDVFGQWTQKNYDFYLITKLMPCYANGSAYAFSTPAEVDLKDNGNSITSYNTIINATGEHLITANTSVIVNFSNYYSFYKLYDARSIYSADNATFNSNSVSWNITWTTTTINYAPYVNFNRTQDVYSPKDWNNTFTFLYNDTDAMSGTREAFGYRLILNDNNTAADWKLIAKSPNHLYSAKFGDGTIETDRYFLGYWTTNSTHAIGHNGSTIVADVRVGGQYGSYYNDTNGALNFTLYDPDGKIVELKTNLPENISFVDVTYYTITTSNQKSEGYYQVDITFDPSVYGSDKPGFWTACVRWDNGTEVGLYSIRIVVQSRTTFEAQWEVEPGSNTWTSDNIARQSNDNIVIKAEYYNISEPFFSGKGHSIPNANVSYTTEWSRSGNFNDYHPLYNTSVLVDATIGNYSVNIVATGAFTENHSVSFYVSVFYRLSISYASYDNYNTNYTNHAYYYFCLYDVIAGNNLSTTPDDMIVKVINSTKTLTLTKDSDYTFTYQSSTQQWKLNIDTSIEDLQTGTYNISVAVYINNYRGNYTDQYARYTFTLVITKPKTDINVVSADSSVYIYSTATINFTYIDTNHTLDIHGAVVSLWSNCTGVSLSWSEDSGLYIVTVEVSNPDLAKVWVFVNVTSANYETINGYLLGTLNVIINDADLIFTQQPQNISVDHEFSIIVYYNDTSHNKSITGASLESYSCNGSITLNLVSFVENGNGYYNITLSVSDPNFDWLNITITLSKAGYRNGIAFSIFSRVNVRTSVSVVGSTSANIYYLESNTFSFLYVDTELNANITNINVVLQFSGNMTGAAESISWHWINNVYYVSINNATATGYYALIVYVVKGGYEGQVLTYSLIINVRPTTTEHTTLTETFYADQTTQLTFNYLDLVNSSSAISNGEITCAFINGSADYFESIVTDVILTSYQITFDPYELNATGLTFTISIILSKYGYEEQHISLTLRVIMKPTSITAPEIEKTIYSVQSTTFIFYYYFDSTTILITGADFVATSLNGTVYFNTISTSSNSTGYYLYLQPNPDVSAGMTLFLNVTIVKPGCGEQQLIVILHVITTPTSATVDKSNVWIYANQNGLISVSYTNNITSQPLTLATIVVETNGSQYLVSEPTYTYNIQTQKYDLIIDLKDSLVAGKVFLINISISKQGFESQQIIVYLHVYPKIKFNLALFIVGGKIQQLTTLQFQVNLTEVQLMALGYWNIKQQFDPRGERVKIFYSFIYANGINETYSIYISITSYDPTYNNYYGQSEEILIPWKVTRLYVTAVYNSTDNVLVEDSSTSVNFGNVAPPALLSLISYFFQHYTAYMATGISIVALILLILTIYLAFIRPKRQKKEFERKKYFDKVSKIVSSVISMRKIIVVHKEASVPVFEWDFGSAIKIDSSLVTGFLQAVSGMAGELSGVSDQTIKKIDYQNFVVNSATSEHYVTYLFSTTDISKDVENGLTGFITWFEKMFHYEAVNWSGVLDRFEKNTRKIIDRISEDLYVWTLYPLSVNPTKEAEIIKLGRLSQKIIKFIKNMKEAPISLILEYFNKLPVEETLSLIFALVDNQFLLRKRLR